MNAQPLLADSTTIRRASTTAGDLRQAADELAEQLTQDDLSLVLLFCSPKLAQDTLAGYLAEHFGDVPVIGCTTAGEITPAGYQHGSITGVSFAAPHFRVATRTIPDIRRFSVADGHSLVQGALGELEGRAPGWLDEQTFAILLIDGMDACEESVVSALHRELGSIPLFGGSAGDELNFRSSRILSEGCFREHAAVLVLVATDHPFSVFKTEHFVSGDEKMVVTGADPVRRIVTEINAEPAAREYARVVGIKVQNLAPMTFANYPVVVRVSGLPYVRSIQKVNPDESLTFFCAIDEGIVLTVANSLDITEDLKELFASLKSEIGTPELVLGCECILRRLEIDQKGLEAPVADILVANNVVGFNTYGEQFNAMHVNQTFTGVAIGRRSAHGR